MERKEKRTKNTALRFLVLAAALQTLLCVFGTRGALEKVFPLYARMVANEVTPEDSSYTEYYPIRSRMTETAYDVIAVGVDFAYEETYTLLLDLVESLKNDINIGTVIVDAYSDTLGIVSSLISMEDEELRENYLTRLREREDCSDSFCDFVRQLCAVNASYPPQRKFSGGSLISASEEASYVEQIVSSVAIYREYSDRPVLVITDADNLLVHSEFRTELEKADLANFCLQCRYEESRPLLWGKTAAVYLLDSSELTLFDDLYAAASKMPDGQYPAYLFSELYSTDVSFLMYNCTAVQKKTADNGSGG